MKLVSESESHRCIPTQNLVGGVGGVNDGDRGLYQKYVVKITLIVLFTLGLLLLLLLLLLLVVVVVVVVVVVMVIFFSAEAFSFRWLGPF